MRTNSDLKPIPDARGGDRTLESAHSLPLTGETAPLTRGPQRVVWVDHLKTFGIFLVIFGHSLHAPTPSSWIYSLACWIYAFHIPLFFLVSGYLIKESHLMENAAPFLVRSAKSLLLPYFVFAAIGYLFWFLVERRFGQSIHTETSPLTPLLAALYGTGKLENFHVEPLVLWFLPCLFVAQALFYFINRLKGGARYVISAVLCGIGFLLPKWLALPFEFEVALVAQGFIALGFEAKRRKWLSSAAECPLVVTLGLLALGSVMALLDSNVDMRSSRFGIPPIFLLSSIDLCLAFALLWARIPRLRLTEIISRNTLIIFSFHPMMFSIFSAFYVFVLRQNLAFREQPTVSLVSSIVNCLLLAFLAEGLSRAFPRFFLFKR